MINGSSFMITTSTQVIYRFVSGMKYCLIFFMALFHSGLSAQNSFSAKLNLPKDVVQGESCIFELTIYKPENVRGFTSFTQNFPEGFFVEKIDVKAAEFSYQDNTLQITWLRIPSDPKIAILYKVSPMYGVTGKFTFNGQLSYMIGSNQAKFDLMETELTVLKEKPVVQSNSNNENENTVIQIHPNLRKDISCKRSIEYNPKKNEYTVELTILSKYSGSCHIIEKVPENFSFEEVTNDNVKIQILKDKVSFKRTNLPQNKKFILKYKLIPMNEGSQKPTIFGKMSILSNGELIQIPVN